MKKTGKKTAKSQNNQPPLGTLRNPWYRIKDDDGNVNYLRVTSYGIWSLKAPPTGAIVKQG